VPVVDAVGENVGVEAAVWAASAAVDGGAAVPTI
jgi:hypothetical protein